jgi:tetratricopeptide (TPR) repeat protein
MPLTRALLLAMLTLLAAPADAFHGVPAVREGMLRATDLLLDLDFEAAEVACRQLLALPQGEAPGRFCLGLAAAGRAEQQDQPGPHVDRFRQLLEETVRAAEQLAATQPSDAEVRLLLGLAHGSRAVVEGERHHYLEAVRALREAHRQFEEALRLDPRLADAYYGLGLYKYSAAHLPVLVRPLVAAVLPRGDAGQGLRELQHVAEHGVYLKMPARMALFRIYAGERRRYGEALDLGRALLRRYAGNPELYFATASMASELGQFREAMEIGRLVAAQIVARHPRFAELEPRYQQLMGKLHMDQGEYVAALAFFDRAIRAPTSERYRWVTAWAWVRSGMIHDALGDRAEAVRRYREGLSIQPDGLPSTVARRHLDAPYRGRSQT